MSRIIIIHCTYVVTSIGGEGPIPPEVGLFYPFIYAVLAPRYGALVVEPEHRFYGTSLPFGSDSYDVNHMQYLTPQQVSVSFSVSVSVSVSVSFFVSFSCFRCVALAFRFVSFAHVDERCVYLCVCVLCVCVVVVLCVY